MTMILLIILSVSNKNIKMKSFKSSENIQKKEGGPDRSVSDNQSSSVTLNELAMKARKDTVISSMYVQSMYYTKCNRSEFHLACLVSE